MLEDNLKIVFFGTGPVAAKSLDFLSKNFNIELVITKQKPKHHRGDWPVVSLCEDKEIKYLYASSKKELDSVLSSVNLESKLGIVIDYGVLIPGSVINKFQLGIINSHFSLLPRWRGADPISFSILSGDKKTGVSLMKIVEELDEGPLIAQKEFMLDDKIDCSELTDELIELSNEMLVKYLPDYINGKIDPYTQAADGATYSKKLKKSDGDIDWNNDAQTIAREIRAFVEWPKSRTRLKNIEIIVTKANVCKDLEQKLKPGEFLIKDKQLVVGCAREAISIKSLKPAGKKIMSVDEFIRGYSRKLS